MEIKPAQMGHHIKMHELAEFPALRDSATKWYKFDARSRQYHNLAHAHRVMAAIRQLTADAGPTLYLAALWHDAVYIPGAGGNVNIPYPQTQVLRNGWRGGVYPRLLLNRCQIVIL